VTQDIKKNIVDMILNSELRSLGAVATNVVSALNESSDLSNIEDIVLKDASLTAQIIKIANSSKSEMDVQRKNLHEAIVRIGHDGIRSICICIGIIENIPLRNHDLRIMIFECLHRSFETAIHAENLTKKATGSDNKDAYIAGLLCNVGELAFLSSSIINLKEYKELIEEGLPPEMACLSLCGLDFDELSEQIVEKWELSTLINDAFNKNPETVKGNAIKVAFDLTRAYYSGQSSKAFIEVSKNLVRDFGFSLQETITFLEKGIESSQLEFNRYGSILQDNTNRHQQGKTTPKASPDAIAPKSSEMARPLDITGQNAAIKKFILLSKKKSSIRVFYSILTDALHNYTAFDRVVLSEIKNNSAVKAANVSGAGADELFADFSFRFATDESTVSTIISTKKPLYISKENDPEVYENVDDSIKTLAGINGEMFLCPIVKNGTVVSIVFMDMGIKRLSISDEQMKAATTMTGSVTKAISMGLA